MILEMYIQIEIYEKSGKLYNIVLSFGENDHNLCRQYLLT